MSSINDWVAHRRHQYSKRVYKELEKQERLERAQETRKRNIELAKKKGMADYEINKQCMYDPAMCDEVYRLAMDGVSHRKIAEAIGVSVRTMYAWRKAYPEFAAALSPVEEMTNEVEMSVFGKAKGYTYTAQKPMSVQGQIEIAEYEEHVPPDMTAARMWLQAHAPAKWSDKSMVAHEVGGLKDMLAAIGKEQNGLAALEQMDDAGIPVTEEKQSDE